MSNDCCVNIANNTPSRHGGCNCTQRHKHKPKSCCGNTICTERKAKQHQQTINYLARVATTICATRTNVPDKTKMDNKLLLRCKGEDEHFITLYYFDETKSGPLDGYLWVEDFFRCRSLKDKLRTMWEIFRHGESIVTEVVLTKENALSMIEWLIVFVNKCPKTSPKMD